MPELSFRLIIDSSGAEAKLEQTGAQANQTRSQVEKPLTLKVQAENALATIRDLKIAFDGVTQIISSVTGKINELLDKAGAQERAERKVAQAVQQTGEAAGFSAQQLYDMAAQLQEVTNFGDEDTLNQVIAQLLTFTNVQGEQFKGAVVAAQNLATVLDGDLQSAAIQLGKALNDPTEGLTALTRSGVSFSQAEQDLIKSMWETGQQAEAQQRILDAINAQYGGQAEAVASLRAQVRNLHGDVEESLGGMLKTLIAPLLNGLKSVYEWFLALSPQQKSLIAGLAAAVPIMVTVATTLTVLKTVVLALNAALAANPVAIVIAGVSALISIVLGAVSALGGWTNAWTLFKELSVAVLSIVWDYVSAFGSFVKDFALGLAQVLTAPYQAMYRTAVEVFSRLASTMRKLVEGDFAGVWSEIRQGVSKAFNDTISSTTGSFKSAFDSFDGLGARAKATWEEVGVTARKSMDDAKQAANTPVTAGAAPGAGGEGETEDKKTAALEAYYNTLRFAAADYYEYMLAQYQADRDAFVKATGDKQKAEAEYNFKVAALNRDREEYQQQGVEAARRAAEEQQRIADEATRAEQENADTRAEFFQAQLTYENNEYQAQIDAIDNYYAQRRDKLLAAGITEEQITRQSELAKAKIRETFDKQHIAGVSGILGNLAKTADAFGKKGFALWKTFAIGQALVDTYSSATAAYKAMAGIPIVGPGLAIAAAAAAIGAGLANVAQISKTEPPKAARGGLLKGNSHAQGGILIEAEGDEFVTSRDRVKSLGSGLFNFLNFAPLSQVRSVLGNIAFPAFPVPEPKLAYAAGGAVGGSNTLADLIDAVRNMHDDLVTSIRASKPSIQVSVDPLSADPVKISELADTGKRIRAEV